MNMRIGLAGVGAAVIVAMAAQTAQAQTCPTDGDLGGGVEQVEVGDGSEPCPPTTYYTPISVDAQNALGEQYTVTGEIENGDDYLQVGEFVEVEIDLGDVMAALKADEENAVALAVAAGIRSSDTKSGVINAAPSTSVTKLSDAEYKALAKYVHVALQNSGRATGRSSPAQNSWTSRAQAFGEAVRNALSTVGRYMPSIGYRTKTREYNDQGVLVRERETDFHIGGRN